MGKKRTSITLESDLVAFIDNEVAWGTRGGSRSDVIERALRAYRDRLSAAAAGETAADPEYQRELRGWEGTLADGLPAEDFSDLWDSVGGDGDKEDDAAA